VNVDEQDASVQRSRILAGERQVTDTRVALIRGINVGRAKRVAMADLRALVEGLGYGDVRTLLNSGNVVFTVPPKSKGEAGSRIEEAMTEKLGVSARITVLTAAELAAVVAENSLLEAADNPSRLLVNVFITPEDRARIEPLAAQDWTPDALAVGSRAAYLWCSGGILDSKLVLAANRALGDGATARNWATITKLQALVEDRSV
jgi:uncharacterized protein (DUF1697 family)